MADTECVRFLQQVLPELGYRWRGFRKVRRQVCRRIRRRFAELELTGGWEAYRARLDERPEEWRVLDRLCRVTVSRFFRDRHFWRVLGEEVLPGLAARRAGDEAIAVWSVGCASGEEPWSLALLWHRRLATRRPGSRLTVAASDVDLHLLARGRRAVYPSGALGELPHGWRADLFEPVAGERGEDEEREESYRLGDEVRESPGISLRWLAHDVRTEPPQRRFDLILCRNLAFTYFDPEHQRRVGRALVERLQPGGFLAIGGHEEVPQGVGELEPWPGERRLLRRDYNRPP